MSNTKYMTNVELAEAIHALSNSIISGLDFIGSVNAVYASETPPSTPGDKDRYIIDSASASGWDLDVDRDGVPDGTEPSKGDVVEYNTSSGLWLLILDVTAHNDDGNLIAEGALTWVENQDRFLVHNGTAWEDFNGLRHLRDGTVDGSVRSKNWSGTLGAITPLGSEGSFAIILGDQSDVRSAYSVVGGGYGNSIYGTNSPHGVINGGRNNAIGPITGDATSIIIAGGENNSILGNSARYALIGGGFGNSINSSTVSDSAAILSGKSNLIDAQFGSCSIIAGGLENQIGGNSAINCVISGGRSNNISGASSNFNVIVGGDGNSIQGASNSNIYNFIGGGLNNIVNGTGLYARGNVIVGGMNSNISGAQCEGNFIGGGGADIATQIGAHIISGTIANNNFIGGGETNSITTSTVRWNSIGGGQNNSITNSQWSSILGGYNNLISSSSLSTVIGGQNNDTAGFENVHIIGSNIDLANVGGNGLATDNTTYTENIYIDGTIVVTSNASSPSDTMRYQELSGSTAVNAGGYVTVTTGADHGLSMGETVIISGSTISSGTDAGVFDGVYTVTVTGTNTFAYIAPFWSDEVIDTVPDVRVSTVVSGGAQNIPFRDSSDKLNFSQYLGWDDDHRILNIGAQDGGCSTIVFSANSSDRAMIRGYDSSGTKLDLIITDDGFLDDRIRMLHVNSDGMESVLLEAGSADFIGAESGKSEVSIPGYLKDIDELIINEKPANSFVPSISGDGSQGVLWVKNDSPNVPMFTDNAGTDWNLLTSGTLRQVGENSTTIASAEYTMQSGIPVKFKDSVGGDYITMQDSAVYRQFDVIGEIKSQKNYIFTSDSNDLGTNFSPLALNDVRTNNNAALISGFSSTDNHSLVLTRASGGGESAAPMVQFVDTNSNSSHTLIAVPSTGTTFPIMVESGANVKASAHFKQGILIGDNSSSSPSVGTIRVRDNRLEMYRLTQLEPPEPEFEWSVLSNSYYTVKSNTGDAIQAELDKAEIYGGTVYVPAGTYRLSSSLFIGSDTHLVLHPEATIKRDNDTVDNLIRNYPTADGGYSAHANIRISGGKWSNDFTTNCTFIAVMHVDGFTVENAIFSNLATWHAIEMNAVKNGRILNCNFAGALTGNSSAEAVQLDSASDTGKYPWDTATRLYDHTACEDILISNCVFSNVNSGIGSHSPYENVTHRRITIEECTFFGSGYYPIRATNWNDVHISDCKFDSNNRWYPNIKIEGYAGSNQGNYTISSNSIFYSGNAFVHTSGDIAIYDSIISNNRMESGAIFTGHMLKFEGSGDHISVIGNNMNVRVPLAFTCFYFNNITNLNITGNAVHLFDPSQNWLYANACTGLLGSNTVNSQKTLVASTFNFLPEVGEFTDGSLVEFDSEGNLVSSSVSASDLALDSEVVHLTGNEVISGVKNFDGALRKSGSDVPSQSGLVLGELVEADAQQNLVTTGKTKENIAFKNEANTFTEINTFENSVVTGVADSSTIYTGTANADIAVSLFKCPVSHCLFAGARSANQTHVTWYKKELGGAWAEYRTPVVGFGTGTRYAYVVMPLRSGRVIFGTGFVNTYLYISDDGGETVTKGYTLDGNYTSILSGIQLRNGNIVLGLGSQNGDGNLVYCTEQENAEDATVWKNIEMNARYDRIFALEEARTNELVVGTGSDLNSAYLVVFPDQNDLATFNEYQIGPSDSLVRVTFLDCSDEAWLINCRDSSNGYKSYFTIDKGVTISAFPDITIEATTYNLVQLKYSSTGRLYASLRDDSTNCFISYCDNATAENIASDSLVWDDVEAVGTGASVTDMIEADGKMYLAAGANGAVWLSEQDFNNTLNREDGQFGAKVLSASKEIVEEGVTLEQKYAQLNKANEFSQKQKFRDDVTLNKNIYSPRDPEFQQRGDIGAAFEQVRTIDEITNGNYNGRILVGTGVTSGDGLVFYSDDRGKTWSQSTGIPSFVRCESVLYISADIVIAGFKGSTVGAQTLYRSTDGGTSFAVLSNFVPVGGDEVGSLAKNKAGRVFIGAGGSASSSQVQYSDNILDASPTFSAATGVLSTDTSIRSLFVDPDTQFVYIGTLSASSATMQRSTDGGTSFVTVTSEPFTDPIITSFSKNSHTGVLTATSGLGRAQLAQSVDGDNWELIYEGFDDGYSTLFQCLYTPDGRIMIGTDSGNILISRSGIPARMELEPIEISPLIDTTRVMFITSRYDMLVGTGTGAAGGGDVWGSPIYNYVVSDDSIIITNRRHHGLVTELPLDGIYGDTCTLYDTNYTKLATGWFPDHRQRNAFKATGVTSLTAGSTSEMNLTTEEYDYNNVFDSNEFVADSTGVFRFVANLAAGAGSIGTTGTYQFTASAYKKPLGGSYAFVEHTSIYITFTGSTGIITDGVPYQCVTFDMELNAGDSIQMRITASSSNPDDFIIGNSFSGAGV